MLTVQQRSSQNARERRGAWQRQVDPKLPPTLPFCVNWLIRLKSQLIVPLRIIQPGTTCTPPNLLEVLMPRAVRIAFLRVL